MLAWMEGYLSKHGDANPRVSARWLLSDATGLSFMQLYTCVDRPLDASELDELRDGVKRRASGEPLQYITGKTSFRLIDVKVREGVLIPRPETEVLVSEALALLPFRKYQVGEEYSGPRMLVADLCTGSGCIACSLAHENPAVDVVATDISEECVKLALENVLDLGLSDRVTVIESDLGEAIDVGMMGSFDAVVSNPPYVPTEVLASIPSEVSEHEPRLALDGGADGLDLFRRVAAWSMCALKPDGFLAVELFEESMDAAAEIARSAGFMQTRVVNDLGGRPRVLLAFKGIEGSHDG